MNYHRFETRAREMWDEVPPEFLEGIDGLVISAEAEAHPEQADVYTLGECRTESYPSDWQGPDTLRSLLVLYHGSFEAVARTRADFDWEGELWETITHELRHHLESLAAEDALEGVDYAMDHEHRRYAGDPFDPFYYRAGEKTGDGAYLVEGAWYYEMEMPTAAGEAKPTAAGEARPTAGAEQDAAAAEGADAALVFEWRHATWETPVPETDADLIFLDVFFPDSEDAEPAEVLTLVLVRPQRWSQALRAVLGRKTPVVDEYEVDVRRLR